MIEVFKTNVENEQQASMLTQLIQHVFPGYRANFDLHDCDNILRIQSAADIEPAVIINLLFVAGFQAEVLPEIEETFSHGATIINIFKN
jgi:hypothetical protein